MPKLEEAKEILKEMQVPERQQSDLCGYVILALANIKDKELWCNATNNWIRIHDIIVFISENYGIAYAENSRETLQHSQKSRHIF